MSSTFFRFLIVGLANTLIGLSVTFVLFHLIDLSYWFATFLGNLLGACSSYLLNKSYTFKSSSPYGKSLIRFVLSILLCYFIAYSIGKKLIELVLINSHSFSTTIISDIAILSSAVLYTILNYVLQKLFVFPVEDRSPMGFNIIKKKI